MKREFSLKSAAETAGLAVAIAPFLRAADVLLLNGEIGAGKTHFARSLIHARQEPLGLLEDVPSPTFTLIQTYPLNDLEIWHADLYRLSAVEEVQELGLVEAFSTCICLVEWPDRLAEDTPARHLSFAFTQGNLDDTRNLTITAIGAGWDWLLDV